MSQNLAILHYLQAGNTLTGLEALRLFGTMKLASRLSEIKRDFPDIKIKSEMIETDTGKRVAKYWIEKDPVYFEREQGQLAIF